MEELIATAARYSKSSRERLLAMAESVKRIERDGIMGDIVECGVWRGGNIMLARMLAPMRLCWLYDTFTGMTEPTELDVKKKGVRAIDHYQEKLAKGKPWAAASLHEVQKFMRGTGTLDEKFCRFVVGDVCETLKVATNLPERIALLRLDTDWHASTKAELEALYPRLVLGGILIVDDYGHWEGARKAVDDYFLDRARPPAHKIDYTAIMMVKGQ